MVRSLANIFYKGIAAFPAAGSNKCLLESKSYQYMGFPCDHVSKRSLYQGLNRFSTTVPNDPDTHEDFKPTSKVESSGLSLKDIVEQDIKENPVMIYMKGVPELPRCGFSALAVRVLKEYDVPLSARNILEDPELKNAVKAISQWPTFPQIFIKGEFVGGSDIILDMHKKGDLERKFEKFEEQSEKE